MFKEGLDSVWNNKFSNMDLELNLNYMEIEQHASMQAPTPPPPPQTYIIQNQFAIFTRLLALSFEAGFII